MLSFIEKGADLWKSNKKFKYSIIVTLLNGFVEKILGTSTNVNIKTKEKYFYRTIYELSLR